MGATIVEQFEAACIKVTQNPDYDRTIYLHLKADKIKLLKLKPKFSVIAKKYIPHTGVGRFPAEIIIKISSIMGVYVNDIATLGGR